MIGQQPDQQLQQDDSIQQNSFRSSASKDSNQLAFVWEIDQIKDTGIDISLEFLQPEMVSMYGVKDMLQITFKNTFQFMMDSEGSANKILPSGYTIITELPRQESKDSSSSIMAVIDGEQLQASS